MVETAACQILNGDPTNTETQTPRLESATNTQQGVIHTPEPTLDVVLVSNATRRTFFKSHNRRARAKISAFELEYRVYDKKWFRCGLVICCITITVWLIVAACNGIEI